MPQFPICAESDPAGLSEHWLSAELFPQGLAHIHFSLCSSAFYSEASGCFIKPFNLCTPADTLQHQCCDCTTARGEKYVFLRFPEKLTLLAQSWGNYEATFLLDVLYLAVEAKMRLLMNCFLMAVQRKIHRCCRAFSRNQRRVSQVGWRHQSISWRQRSLIVEGLFVQTLQTSGGSVL